MATLVTQKISELPKTGENFFSPGKLRVFCIIDYRLGSRQFSKLIEQHLRQRSDVDFIIYNYVRPFWLKVFSAQILPKNRDFNSLRLYFACKMYLRFFFPRKLLRSTDLIFFHTQVVGGFLDFLPEDYSGKVVVGMDETAAVNIREVQHSSIGLALYRRIEKKIFRRADRVFPWSKRIQASLINDYGKSPELVTVLYPSTCTPKFNHIDTDDLVHVGFVGEDFERKGGPILVEIFREHFKDKAKLHIVSRQFLSEPNDETVKGYGFVPHEQVLDDFLPRMDLFVHYAREEGYGLALVEAQARGVPVIALNIGSVSELIEHGVTGFVCEQKHEFIDALRKLIDSTELRKQFAHAAYERACRQFDPQKNIGAIFRDIKGVTINRSK